MLDAAAVAAAAVNTKEIQKWILNCCNCAGRPAGRPCAAAEHSLGCGEKSELEFITRGVLEVAKWGPIGQGRWPKEFLAAFGDAAERQDTHVLKNDEYDGREQFFSGNADDFTLLKHSCIYSINHSML